MVDVIFCFQVFLKTQAHGKLYPFPFQILRNKSPFIIYAIVRRWYLKCLLVNNIQSITVYTKRMFGLIVYIYSMTNCSSRFQLTQLYGYMSRYSMIIVRPCKNFFLNSRKLSYYILTYMVIVIDLHQIIGANNLIQGDRYE